MLSPNYASGHIASLGYPGLFSICIWFAECMTRDSGKWGSNYSLQSDNSIAVQKKKIKFFFNWTKPLLKTLECVCMCLCWGVGMKKYVFELLFPWMWPKTQRVYEAWHFCLQPWISGGDAFPSTPKYFCIFPLYLEDPSHSTPLLILH